MFKTFLKIRAMSAVQRRQRQPQAIVKMVCDIPHRPQVYSILFTTKKMEAMMYWRRC